MMRLVLFLALACLAGAAPAQDVDIPAFSWLKPKVDVTELQAKIDDQARMIKDLRGIIGQLELDLANRGKVIDQFREELDGLTEKNLELIKRLSGYEENGEPLITCKIVMETIDGCDSCKNWWNGTDPETLFDQGWAVRKRRVTPRPGKFYPRWLVCMGNQCTEIEYTPNFLKELANVVEAREQQKRLNRGRTPVPRSGPLK